jgi:hypothetical protein
MYFCFPPQRQTIPPKHACISFAAPQRADHTCSSIRIRQLLLYNLAHQSCEECATMRQYCTFRSHSASRSNITYFKHYCVLHGCMQLMAVQFHAVSFCICLFLYLWFCFLSTPVDHFTLKVDWVRKDNHVRSSSPCCLYSSSLSAALASHM